MKIFIASEFRCSTFNGEYYLSSKAYSIYKRYADAFGDIILCCRVVGMEKLDETLFPATFIDEVIQINNLGKVFTGVYDNLIRSRLNECDLAIVRLPSIIAYRCADIAIQNQIPYLSELMCDGWDPYWNHGIKGKIIAPYMHMKMKKITYQSDFALYVTEKYLQRRYPCKNASINSSNVLIKNVDISVYENRVKRINSTDMKNLSLMTTANVDIVSKGQKYVIKSIKSLAKMGINVKYYLVGAGDKRKLEKIAIKENVVENIIFLGQQPLEKIMEIIDHIDIYIQPSLQEGLPRAVIEAMSRGCPCLGADTAGIPELLDAAYIFDRASVKSIINIISKLDKSDLYYAAEHNFAYSKMYTLDKLDKRRNDYFQKVKDCIEIGINET